MGRRSPLGVRVWAVLTGNAVLGRVLLAWFASCLAALALGLLYRRWAQGPWLAKKPKRVGLVVAHPDDEAMFFWPSLLQLARESVPLSVLCLSNGNADGLGQLREAEMRLSCERLGVKAADVTILDVEDLEDGFQRWPEHIVSTHVLDFVRAQQVDLVITFDDFGVSGHPNHISTGRGVLRAASECTADVTRFQVATLESVGFFRKYLGPIDLFMTLVLHGRAATLCASPLECLRALSVHWTQLVWYRALFALFSRYAYMNTFVLHSFDEDEIDDITPEKVKEGDAVTSTVVQRRRSKK